MRRVPELNRVEYANVHEDQRRSFDVVLRDVLQDRQRELAGTERHERVRIQPPDLARLSEQERQHAEGNIRLLSLLKGHRGRMIRTASERGSSEESRHLRTLLTWIDQTLRSGMASIEPLVAPPPSEWWAKAQSPEDLYERLVLIERSGTNNGATAEAWLLEKLAAATNNPNPQPKWTDLVKPLFEPQGLRPRLERVLAEVGFLPRGLTTRQTFRSLPAVQVVGALDALRQLETSRLRPLARYERARLTNALLARGRASELRSGRNRPVTLDTNGVRVDAGSLHAHIPYGLLEDETVAALEKDHWTQGISTLFEIRLRAAEENMDGESVERIRAEQLSTFLSDTGFSEPGALAACADRLTDQPDAFAKLLIEKQLTVPDLLVNALIERGPKGRFALLRFAEGIGAAITEERLTRQAHLFLSYRLLEEQDESYKTRVRILNQPEYYNALKIVRGWLSRPVASEPDNRFLAVHGSYQPVAGNERHGFVAAVLDGRVTRVLVDEHKHLHEEQREVLEALPAFERSQYERLEDVLRTFDYFCATVNSIRKEAAKPPKSWPRRFHELAQTALHFVLSNVTSRLPDATRLYQAATNANASRESVEALLEVFDDARQTYAKFLYENVGAPRDFAEEFMPEIQRREIAFGEPFIEYAKQVCATDGYDERLTRNAPPIRVVAMHYKTNDPTGAIPFHMEEACLEAIRLDRTQPLINVIGGCRFVSGSLEDADHPLNKMATSLLKVAHDIRANVAVPGTQSGIGVAFGLANTHYRNTFGHLPKKDQMHMFSVSPGGNTAFPGNAYVEQSEQWQRFAITPADSIITPFESQWGAVGMARLTVPYREHILYMEALYDRLSRDQKRVTVVGNGGHFSLMEVNEALKRGFDLILIRDSGRFAEAAAAVLASGESLEDGGTESCARVIALVREASKSEVAEEFLKKDFGVDPPGPTETHMAFRILFFEFLRITAQTKANIQLTSLDALERELRARMQ